MGGTQYVWQMTVAKNMHSEVKLSKCKFCEKRFTSNGKLIKHQYTQSEKKLFKCKFCENFFVEMEN